MLAVAFGIGAPAPASGAVRSAINDVNGDGYADLLVPGSEAISTDGSPGSASIVVLLGRSTTTDVDLRSLPPEMGYHLRTAGKVTMSRPVGDIDADGYSDVVVGIASRTVPDEYRTVTVFGSARRQDVDLDQTSADVMPRAWEGTPVGDVNGDRIGDSAFVGDVNDVTVLFGRRGRAPVTRAELRRPGRRGFMISVAFVGNISVMAAGDATGDGLADVAVVYEDDYEDLTTDTVYGGPVFVVAGRRGPARVQVADRSLDGYPVRLRGSHRRAGYAVRGWAGNVIGSAGDFDGDGRDDLLVAGPSYGGPARVVHGRAPRDFGDRAARHLTAITGTPIGSDTGAPLGDVNGDGLADIVISITRIFGGTQTGRLAVVLGRNRRGVIDRRRRDPRTWRLTAPTGVRMRPSGPIGDINGDGYADLLLTEDRDDGLAARRYVVLGGRRRPPGRLAALAGRGFVVE